MADEYSIIDLVTNTVESARTGFIVYKNRSADAEKNNHITIRSLTLNESDYVNTSYINVNVFVKNHDNGMSNIKLMKDIVRTLKKALKSIDHPLGMYWKSRIVWSEPVEGAKEGFDCKNIRLYIITEK